MASSSSSESAIQRFIKAKEMREAAEASMEHFDLEDPKVMSKVRKELSDADEASSKAIADMKDKVVTCTNTTQLDELCTLIRNRTVRPKKIEIDTTGMNSEWKTIMAAKLYQTQRILTRIDGGGRPRT